MMPEWLAAVVVLLVPFAAAAIVAYSQAASAEQVPVPEEGHGGASQRRAVAAGRTIEQHHLQELQAVNKTLLCARTFLTDLHKSVANKSEIQEIGAIDRGLSKEIASLRWAKPTADQDFDRRLSAILERLSAHRQNLLTHAEGTVRHAFEPMNLISETQAIWTELDQLQKRLALGIETNRSTVQRG